ncbi:DUF6471 domain-containing protein [Caballeronia grimmiae]|uniref:DUF6471 domain-containing protein n=1 Tax=Caballeronia grimmiae TaxID=1071679 RepID=UPI0038B6E7CF
MSEADTPWSRLASRATRVALTRKDMTYSSLVDALARDGVSVGERAIVSKISRGTLRVSLFLQILAVTRVQFPERWTEALRQTGTWEERASGVFRAELDRQPSIRLDDIAGRLSRLGPALSAASLDAQLRAGSLQLSVFIQLIHILNSDSLDRFIDQADIVDAARSVLEIDNA